MPSLNNDTDNNKITTVTHWEHTVSKHCACALNDHEILLLLYNVAALIILILYMESELREFKKV